MVPSAMVRGIASSSINSPVIDVTTHTPEKFRLRSILVSSLQIGVDRSDLTDYLQPINQLKFDAASPGRNLQK